MIEFPKLYKEFAKYYDRLENQYRDYEKEAAWLDSILSETHSNQVIDISCGTGRHLDSILKINKDRHYVALDASAQMTKIASKRLVQSHSNDVLVADFLKTPFTNELFDAAICMYWSIAGLDHSQVRALFCEVARILEFSGIFVLDVENADGIKEDLLNIPFIDAFFTDPETQLNLIRANLSTKVEPDVVDWHAYYLIEENGVSKLVNDQMKLRFYSRSNVESFLREAGFDVLSVLSTAGGSYESNSPSLYFVAQKKR